MPNNYGQTDDKLELSLLFDICSCLIAFEFHHSPTGVRMHHGRIISLHVSLTYSQTILPAQQIATFQCCFRVQAHKSITLYSDISSARHLITSQACPCVHNRKTLILDRPTVIISQKPFITLQHSCRARERLELYATFSPTEQSVVLRRSADLAATASFHITVCSFKPVYAALNQLQNLCSC